MIIDVYMSESTAYTTEPHLHSHKAALALLVAAAALTMVALPESRLLSACGDSEGSGCTQVIGGPWSYWLALLPVQWPGLAMYAGPAAAAWQLSPSSPRKHRSIRVLCGAIIGAVVWFSLVQAWVLKQFCPLCVTIHLCAGFAAAFLLSAVKSTSLSPAFGLHSVFVSALATWSLLAAG